MGMGAAVPCPGNTCSGFNGNGQFVQFVAGAGGAQAYLPSSAWAQGVNEVNGSFLSDADFQAYLRLNFGAEIDAHVTATIAGLEAKGAGPDEIDAFVKDITAHPEKCSLKAAMSICRFPV